MKWFRLNVFLRVKCLCAVSNFKNVWYSSELFFGAIFIGTFIAISRRNWILAWMGIELNMIAFLGWMCTRGKVIFRAPANWGFQGLSSYFPRNVEPFAKYFLAQSVGSALFLFFPLVLGVPGLMAYSGRFILFGMIIKRGVAPFHQWFPSVCSKVSWGVNIFLIFWQKIGPLYILVGVLVAYHQIMLLFALVNLFFGVFGALGQTQLRSLFAYSSISHMGWIFSMAFFSKVGFFYYFLLYGGIVLPIIGLFYALKLYSFKDVQKVPWNFWVFFLLLASMVLRIAGMPPFTGFFIKAYRIYLILSINYFRLALIFCVFAVIGLSYYINIIFFSFVLGILSYHKKDFNPGFYVSPYSWSNSLSILFIVVLGRIRLPFVGGWLI